MNLKKTFFAKFFHFFDKLEDKTRRHLSKYPILYALIAGVFVILFWRAVWHTGDILESKGGILGFLFSGPISLVISLFVLLLIGIFVSTFVGDMIIMSGLKREKKIVDKTEQDIQTEKDQVQSIEGEIELIENNQERLERKIDEQARLLRKLLDK